jgi:hypothetical protein
VILECQDTGDYDVRVYYNNGGTYSVPTRPNYKIIPGTGGWVDSGYSKAFACTRGNFITFDNLGIPLPQGKIAGVAVVNVQPSSGDWLDFWAAEPSTAETLVAEGGGQIKLYPVGSCMAGVRVNEAYAAS